MDLETQFLCLQESMNPAPQVLSVRVNQSCTCKEMMLWKSASFEVAWKERGALAPVQLRHVCVSAHFLLRHVVCIAG